MSLLQAVKSPPVPPAIDPPVAEGERTRAAWGLGRRLLFRFACAYVLLYLLPFPVEVVPGAEPVVERYYELWHSLVPWAGQQVFGLEITIRPGGSGDTTYNYVQLFCYLVLALAAAAVWSLLDRKRAEYERLHEWLRVYVRYALAAAMLLYGGVKVIKAQFPDPWPSRLLDPFGESSPMGLLWTFMGASESYTVFSGAAEMLAGLLLTTRRTTLLGALLAIGVLANVVMLNFCYDVPVKLYSLHLLALAVFLTLPDLRRLADLFLWNRRVRPAAVWPLFGRRSLDLGGLALRTAFVAVVAGSALHQAWDGSLTYGDLAPRPPLHGIWNVDELEVDGQARPPLLTDAGRWRRVIFEYPGFVEIQRMDRSREGYPLALDAGRRTLALTRRNQPDWRSVLSFRGLGPGRLGLEGTFDGKRLRAVLRRTDESELRLVSRGFHWINEYPYNQ